MRPIRCEHAQAHVTFTAGKVDYIKTDPMQGGLIPNVLHELFHVVLRKEMSLFSAEVEEWIILELESSCYKWLSASERRLKPWRTLVERRLKEPK